MARERNEGMAIAAPLAWTELEKSKPSDGERCVVVTATKSGRVPVVATFAAAIIGPTDREIMPARFILDGTGEYVTDVRFWAQLSAAPEGA